MHANDDRYDPLTQPDLRPLPCAWRPRYVLASNYPVQWERQNGTIGFTVVPSGTVVDGSSEWRVSVLLPFLPAGLVWFLGLRADGPHRAAALVHDWLYLDRKLSREEADWAFWVLSLRHGVTPWRAKLRWRVLRLVGWAVY